MIFCEIIKGHHESECFRLSKVNHVRKNTCFVQLSARKCDCDLLGADMKIPYSLTYTSDHFE